ncbi:MAG: type I-F CRISPR-associated protein Csy1 [Legionella sp.]|nr:MAG: type I-F CRISPR-associated protein Csy1 [Legionella sp.]PJD98430.1 MAG: type I-F CRISPR-associated protein Csy1 [Legionella sp.]
MIDPAIINFFNDKKATWLNKAISTSMTDVDIAEKNQACEELFCFENWLPDAARRAGQLSISTHPCTFSHPSSRKNKNGYVSPVIAKSQQNNDGYLRSGNLLVEYDILGNAAALDVHKFLMLILQDGKTLLQHIKENSDQARSLLAIKSETYESLRSGFLAITQDNNKTITSSKIKQVYFPVDNDYHLLSTLTSSGAIYDLKKRIDTIHFSESTIEAIACKKENRWHPTGYKQLSNLTTISYGGTQKQNISVLNFKNKGKAYLLVSEPPHLVSHNIRFPTLDFFNQSINYYQCSDLFHALHELFIQHKNNWHIRQERDEYYLAIIDRIIERMWLIREIASEQFNPQSSQLNSCQKIWLCDEYQATRDTEDDWLGEITYQLSQFIVNGYENILGQHAFMFSDTEFNHIYQLVCNQQEALR